MIATSAVLLPRDDTPRRCLSLIGMAGAGKSTLGALLARRLDWAHLDTDRLLESYYGLPLQQLLDSVGLETFLQLEEHQVGSLGAQRVVISTGGSVVYSRRAVDRLRMLGPVVFLEIDLATFLERVGHGGGRGLAVRPGRSFEELYAERQPLYRAAADFSVDTGAGSPEDCAVRILDWFGEKA
ncbi:homoserine kinase [Desulfovibrio aminophilus]|uniref:homoserine kinase n=1 Tax=Desulfovibrio aminophilus TaxID=81425 RepID=UPI000421F3BA|nr:homoserine kinase [Desulfovibrio aminophilus]